MVIGNNIINKVLLMLWVAMALFASGIFVYTEMIFEKDLPSDQVEFERLLSETQERSQMKTLKLEKVILNLHSRGTRLRFLDLEMEVQPFRQEYHSLLEKSSHLFYDTALDIAGRMSPQELNTVAGKILLEDRIKRDINDQFSRPVVKKIFFTTFVIQ